jgi:PAS domain S-box-containing protein
VPLAEGLWATLNAGGRPGPVVCAQESAHDLGRTEITLSPGTNHQVLVHLRSVSAHEAGGGRADPLHRRLQLAAQAAQLGVWEWEIAGNRITWDPGMANIYGLPDHGANPADWQWERWALAEDQPAAKAALDRALSDPLATRFAQSFRIRRPDGELRWVRSHGVIERNGYGRAVRVTGINSDVTEERALQDRLQRASARLEIATGAMALGVWELDPGTGLETWDDRMLALFDVPRAEFTTAQAAWFARVHPEDREFGWDIRTRTLGDPAANHLEQVVRIVTRTGEHRWLKISATIQRAPDGTPLRVVGVNSDITEQQAASERLFSLSTGTSAPTACCGTTACSSCSTCRIPPRPTSSTPATCGAAGCIRKMPRPPNGTCWTPPRARAVTTPNSAC